MKNTAAIRISFTLLLSLTAHVAIVVVWPGKEYIPQAGGQGMTISLVVLANKQPPATTGRLTDSKKLTSRKTLAAINNKQRNNTAVTSSPTMTKSVKTIKAELTSTREDKHLSTVSVPREEHSAQAVSHNQQERLENVLRKAFNAQFYYPRMAVRRGWQGEVHLGLRIESNGQLSKVHILRSSGHDLLDTAAMKSLRKVEVLADSIALLNGHSLNLVLPVKYRLL